MQQPNTQMPDPTPKKATIGFALSIVGGILILARGLVRIAIGDFLAFSGSDEIRRRFLAGIAFNVIGGVAVVFALLIFVGAYLIYTGTTTAGGVIVIVFSSLSILVGSGWLVGLILGLVGGILGVLKK